MTLTIHNTTKLVTLNGVPARIWEGTTESGIPVHCFVSRVAVDENLPAEQLEQFERELKTVRPPTPEIAAIPARLLM